MQFSTFPMMMMMVGWAFAFIYNQVHINIKVWTWRGKVCIPKLSQISINGCSKIIYSTSTSNILCTKRKKIMQQYRREVSWGFGTRYILSPRVTCQLFSNWKQNKNKKYFILQKLSVKTLLEYPTILTLTCFEWHEKENIINFLNIFCKYFNSFFTSYTSALVILK